MPKQSTTYDINVAGNAASNAAKVSKALSATAKSGEELGKSSSSSLSKMSQLGNVASGVKASFDFAAAAVKAVYGAVTELAATQSKVKSFHDSLSAAGPGAAQLATDIENIGDSAGWTLDQTREMGSVLGRAFGGNASTVKGLLSLITDTAGTFGLTSEASKALAEKFADLGAKGNVAIGDIEALGGTLKGFDVSKLYESISQNTGKSVKAIKDLAQKGKLSLTDLSQGMQRLNAQGGALKPLGQLGQENAAGDATATFNQVSNMWQKLQEQLAVELFTPQNIALFKDLAVSAITGLKSVSGAISNLTAVFNNNKGAAKALKSGFQTIGFVLSILGVAVATLAAGVVAAFALIPAAGDAMGQAVFDTVQGIVGLWDGVKRAWDSAISGIVSAAQSFVTFWATLPDKVFSIGSQIVQGIVNGLLAAPGALVAAAENLASTVLTSFKKKLGIASPSKLFALQGEYIGQGTEEGLAKSESGVAKASSDLASATINGYDAKSTADQLQPVAAQPTVTLQPAPVIVGQQPRVAAPVTSSPTYNFAIEVNVTSQSDANDIARVCTDAIRSLMSRDALFAT